jgi:hypothetical protein
VPDIAVFTWNPIPLDEEGDIANVFAALRCTYAIPFKSEVSIEQ